MQAFEKTQTKLIKTFTQKMSMQSSKMPAGEIFPSSGKLYSVSQWIPSWNGFWEHRFFWFQKMWPLLREISSRSGGGEVMNLVAKAEYDRVRKDHKRNSIKKGSDLKLIDAVNILLLFNARCRYLRTKPTSQAASTAVSKGQTNKALTLTSSIVSAMCAVFN